MDIKKILEPLRNCPCGKDHSFDTERVEIAPSLTAVAGDILRQSGFPEKILLVADRNTLGASPGLLDSLDRGGFEVKQLIYQNLLSATAERVSEVEALAEEVGGIISVGTGSLNDICRVAAYRKELDYCIFATAPSMDGFASDTAPIIKNGFKTSWQARQPRIIIGDTEILRAAPPILKAAGFGDMMGKYIGLVDWHISRLLTGEYYCERVAAITKEAADKTAALASRIKEDSCEAAGCLTEALIMTGLAMKLAGCSRPASGTEHIVSHYLECHKLLRGQWPDFHGRKVAVATVYCNRIYRAVAEKYPVIHAHPAVIDMDDVLEHYHPVMHRELMDMNYPSVTEEIDPARLEECWPEIRQIILDTLPEDEYLVEMMKEAGTPTTAEEISVDADFMKAALLYHPYMRRRIHLPRLFPMMDIDVTSLL